jgi:hypothetical protein
MTFPPGNLWDCSGSLDIRGNRKWRWTRKGGNCSPVCWTGTGLVGLQAEYKKKDKMLDWPPAHGNVLGPSTQRQAQKLILGPSANAKVPGLLLASFTGHNTLRRHHYLVGLMGSPLCRRCGTEEKTSAHVLSVCVKLWLHSHTLIWGSLFWTLRMLEVQF